MDSAPLDVLLVDDDPADVALVEEAFATHRLPSRLHVAGNGLAALAFLHREQAHADAPRPDLVLLDLNMPRMDGRELLTTIKQDEDLRVIPVIVFTTSALDTDIAQSYVAGANAYVAKPLDLDAFSSAVEKIHDFFGDTVTLPAGRHGRADEPGGTDTDRGEASQPALRVPLAPR